MCKAFNHRIILKCIREIRFILLITVLFVLTGAQGVMAQDKEQESKSYGEDITLQDTTAVSKLLEKPEDYVGKRVLVKGRIVNVCKKRGCWMALSGDKEFQSIRIKVDDGVIVFPFESKGKLALAEGEVETFEMSIEQTKKYLKHEAECNGDPFDEASITKPMVMVQIKGSGAVIYE
jgi:hypothetical protein